MSTFSFDGVFDLDEALSMPPLYSSPMSSSFSHNAVIVTADTFPVVVTSKDAVCSVCTEEFEPPRNSGRQIPCGHVYHADCISAWLSVHDSCPLCRVAVVMVDQKNAYQ
ncbi:hypothetical protein SOVF_188000 [Spinacia oleracea]|uniref:E3 ubiquitin-protein ligase RZF1-like n=1 Tax=Spinacia oleracea TaxID=3562 RepID=A0A9R0HWP0_SPIOL|nr:E3 ubiquitin-protein ligase RZF1-like [Spinacia oleracea]KNA05680.1 hypothetical protein SOVF_188000 [Spinacia oleracea]